MKGYTLPCTLLLVFVMSITVEGCQETGEIKVNSNDKYIIVRVWICNISLICQWRLSHPGNINQVLRETHRLFSSLLEYFGGIQRSKTHQSFLGGVGGIAIIAEYTYKCSLFLLKLGLKNVRSYPVSQIASLVGNLNIFLFSKRGRHSVLLFVYHGNALYARAFQCYKLN